MLGRPYEVPGTAPFTQTLLNGGSLAAVRGMLVHSSEVTSDLSTAYNAAKGAAPDVVQLAAYQSELGSGNTIGTLLTEISGAAKPLTGPAANSATSITGESLLLGSVPVFIYGLGNNDALLPFFTSQPSVAEISGGGAYNAYIAGFRPTVDVIRIQSSQAASFSALNLSQTSGTSGGVAVTTIALGGSNFINIAGVTPNALHASNFSFV